jgi:hypothetical protein
VGDLTSMAEGGGFEQDPRWISLQRGATVCSSCGQTHRGIFAIAYPAPFYWTGNPTPVEPRNVQDWNSFLTSDLCVVGGEHFFVRCTIELPLRGVQEETFSYGVWASLSKSNFQIYYNSFRSDEQGRHGPWFGWLSNRIAHFPDTLELKCHVRPQNGNRRPFLELEATEHQLSIAQREGLTADQLFAIYSAHGHTFS